MLEKECNLSAREILDIIDRSPRCRQMVIGFVAEYHLEKVLKELPLDEVTRIDQDGRPDFEISYRGRKFLLECKNVMSSFKYKDGNYKVDFQKTRNAKDDPTSRFYKTDDFHVLAACLYPQTGKWKFIFARTKNLPKDKKYSDLPSKSVKVAPHIQFPWTKDLIECLKWEMGLKDSSNVGIQRWIDKK